MNLYNTWDQDLIVLDYDNAQMFLEDEEYSGIEISNGKTLKIYSSNRFIIPFGTTVLVNGKITNKGIIEVYGKLIINESGELINFKKIKQYNNNISGIISQNKALNFTYPEKLSLNYKWVDTNVSIENNTQKIIVGPYADLTDTNLQNVTCFNYAETYNIIANGNEPLNPLYKWVKLSQDHTSSTLWAIVGPTVTLSYIDLSNTDLQNCIIDNTTNIIETDFTGCNLTGSHLMEITEFLNSTFNNIKINGHLPKLNNNYIWIELSIDGIFPDKLEDKRWAIIGPQIHLNGIDFTNCNLRNKNLSSIQSWEGAKTSNIIAKGTEPLDSKYKWVLTGPRLNNIIDHNACNIDKRWTIVGPYAILSNINLFDTDLTDTDLNNTDLNNAITYNIRNSNPDNNKLPSPEYKWVHINPQNITHDKKWAIIGPHVNIKNIDLSDVDLSDIHTYDLIANGNEPLKSDYKWNQTAPTDIDNNLIVDCDPNLKRWTITGNKCISHIEDKRKQFNFSIQNGSYNLTQIQNLFKNL